MSQVSNCHRYRWNLPSRLAIASLFLVSCAGPASACGECSSALADRYLPPIELWCCIAVFWYLATAFVASWYNTRIKGFPSFVWSFLIAVMVVLHAVGAMGLWAMLPLAIPAILAYVRSRKIERTAEYPHGLQIALRRLGFVMLVTISMASLLSLKIHLQRTPAEFDAKWKWGSRSYREKGNLRFSGRARQSAPAKAENTVTDLP